MLEKKSCTYQSFESKIPFGLPTGLLSDLLIFSEAQTVVALQPHPAFPLLLSVEVLLGPPGLE